jgi:hypothetical protein
MLRSRVRRPPSRATASSGALARVALRLPARAGAPSHSVNRRFGVLQRRSRDRSGSDPSTGWMFFVPSMVTQLPRQPRSTRRTPTTALTPNSDALAYCGSGPGRPPGDASQLSSVAGPALRGLFLLAASRRCALSVRRGRRPSPAREEARPVPAQRWSFVIRRGVEPVEVVREFCARAH